MSWTAYHDRAVARKMTSLALQELGRWIIEPNFHEPWNVFKRFMNRIRTPGYNGPRTFLDVGCAAGYYGAVLRLIHGHFWHYNGVESSGPLRELAFHIFGFRPYESIAQAEYRSWSYEKDTWEVVLSGSVLQHEEHWEPFLNEQLRVCDRWLIIHKIPIAPTLVMRQKQAYGATMNEWNFPVTLINEKIGREPVEEHWFKSSEPHWSGLYDLGA